MEIERKGFHTYFTEKFNMRVEPINDNEKPGVGFFSFNLSTSLFYVVIKS